MPIDPSILQGIRPVQAPSLLDTYEQITRLQDQKRAGEERRAAAQEKQQVRAQEAHYAELLQSALRAGPDGRPTIDVGALLGAGAPADLVFRAQQSLDEMTKREADARTSTLAADKQATQYLGGLAKVIKEGGYSPNLYGPALIAAKAKGAITSEEFDRLLQEATVDETAIQRHTDAVLAAVAPAPKLAQIQTMEGGVAGTRFVPEQAGTFYPSVPKASDSPAVGSFEDYVVRRFGPTPTSEQITQARKDYQQADDRPITVNAGGGAADDDQAEAIAEAIIRGEQPPTTTGLYRYGALVRAHLAKKGYPLATAQTDWTATQRHFNTLNGAQQTRLRQAVDTAAHSLDLIDTLAGQWKGSGFPVLNRINLAAATHGVYGPNAASVAQQLTAQIADLTSELGNVYMGGNSPTDHALQLAKTNLSADWSEKVLKDMTALARTNLRIRQNAIRNVAVIGASENNPYAAAPPGGGGETTNKRDPLGIR